MDVVLIGLGLVLLVVFPFLFDFRSIRMAMKVKKGDYQGAIALAESIPEERRSVAVVINQIAAYYHGGEVDKAKDLFQVANRRKDYPAGVAQDLLAWEKALFP